MADLSKILRYSSSMSWLSTDIRCRYLEMLNLLLTSIHLMLVPYIIGSDIPTRPNHPMDKDQILTLSMRVLKHDIGIHV